MAEKFYPLGKVVSGDYSGKNVYKGDDESYAIVDNDDNGKIVKGLLWTTDFKVIETISKANVDHHELLSVGKTEASTKSVADGVFWLGTMGGLLAAETNKSESYNVAIYFKNGKKSLIRFASSLVYEDFVRMMF